MPTVHAKRVAVNDLSEEVDIEFIGERQLGRGRFSGVHRAELIKPEKMAVAIKMMHMTAEIRSVSTGGEPVLPAEIVILSKLSSPFTIKAFYYFKRQIANDLFFCVMLNMMPSDMEKLCYQERVQFDGLDAQLYAWQLLSALMHLESRSIVHLDIKPANILVDHKAGRLQLADFGNAYFMEEVPRVSTGYLVTRYYRPPELLFEGKTITPACDIWSAACVIYEFITNRQLFKARDKEGQIPMILQVLGYPTEEDIKSMNVKRPRHKKYEARGLAKYTSGFLDATSLALLQSILLYDPTKRAKPAACLKHAFFDKLKMEPPPTRSNGQPVKLPCNSE